MKTKNEWKRGICKTKSCRPKYFLWAKLWTWTKITKNDGSAGVLGFGKHTHIYTKAISFFSHFSWVSGLVAEYLPGLSPWEEVSTPSLFPISCILFMDIQWTLIDGFRMLYVCFINLKFLLINTFDWLL